MRNARQLRELTLDELAAKIHTSKQVLSRYENDIHSPKIPTAQRIADALDIPLDCLLYDNLPPTAAITAVPSASSLPLIGSIACGTPILADENIEGTFPAPDFIHADFCLRCKGDSMIGARILDGDIAYIRQQDDVTDGEIAAVLIDDEATLKRVRHLPGGMIQLVAENPAYPPMYLGGEAETRSIRIIGKAVYFLSRLK